jgi:hypothetical protein
MRMPLPPFFIFTPRKIDRLPSASISTATASTAPVTTPPL